MKRMKLHTIQLLLPLLAVTACSTDELDTKQTLSGEGKTPLEVTALLDVSQRAEKSRAADKDFAIDDELIAYLRHVEWNGGFTADDTRTPVSADQAPKLVTFTCTGSKAWNGSEDDIHPFLSEIVAITGTGDTPDTKQAKDLTTTPALYWDDFSESTDDGAKDLRTPGHYLQSYYGYCYNGGAPTAGTELDTPEKKALGKIGWTILTDQSTVPTNFKKSDLLWSAEQTPVSYTHRDQNVDNERPGLLIPYTHAMSKVTIKVTAGEGFASNYAFQNADGTVKTTIRLNDIRTSCTATAPTASLDFEHSTKADVTMKPGTTSGTRSFEAIVVPSILTVGNTFATITGMDGNTYTIPVTDAMVQKASENAGTGWGDRLDDKAEDVNNGTAQSQQRADATVPKGNGHQMRSGVHYVLNVTLNKTDINISATILDWDAVEAEGIGEIHFADDVKTTGDIEEALRDNDIYIYKSETTTFGTAATRMHWNKTQQKWKYTPIIYWQSGDAEYFRALSNVRADAEGTTDKNESLIMANGQDALWGTTEDVANGYAEGDPIKPRTGDVPLKFYHAMSKITFKLVDANAGDASAALDLRNATIQLTNLATDGTLDLTTGLITPRAISGKSFSEDPGAIPARMGLYAANDPTVHNADETLLDYIITPQNISNEAAVVITMADGSIYKAQLNKCTTQVVIDGVSTDKIIDSWKRSNHYTYTISLGKESIIFRAVVEPWNPVKGGGKATLEWD